MNDRIYTAGVARLRNPDRIERMEVERVVDLCLNGTDISSILDIGTGSGVFAEAFSKSNIFVAGIDLNPDMIEAARDYVPNAELKIGVAEEIPFKPDQFDASFFGLVFHEVSDYGKAMSEAYRVSKVACFILEWNYKTEDFGPPIDHRLKPEFIKQVAEEIGFKKFEKIELSSMVLYKLVKYEFGRADKTAK